MSWPSNANVGHDWLLDEWPWDPLSLGLALDWTASGGARHNFSNLDSSTHASTVQPQPAPVAEAPGRGGGAPGGGAQPTTLKRDRPGSRPSPVGGPDARMARKQARGAAAVCRVPGCGVAMESLSAYCKRTRSVPCRVLTKFLQQLTLPRCRLCSEHQVAAQVVMGDGVMRFCQKWCVSLGKYLRGVHTLALTLPPLALLLSFSHVLQPLAAFDGLQRTCSESLARHNARRRARKPRAVDTLVAGLERVGSDTSGGGAGLSGPGAQDSLQDSPEDTATAGGSADDASGGPTLTLRRRDGGADLGASVMAVVGLQRFNVEVKLPSCPTPASLPSGDVLQAVLEDSLGSVMDTTSVAIVPGCVRLVIDGMQRAGNEAAAHAIGMAQQLADMLRQRGGQQAAGARMAGLCSDAAPSSLFPLAAILLPPADGASDEVAVPATSVLPAGAKRLAVRCWGRDVRCDLGAGGQVSLHLSAVPYAGGCLLVEARGSDGERLHRPRAVVASRDAALVEELNDAFSRGLLPEEAMQAVLHVLGDALTPHTTWEVRCSAAAAVSRAGLGASLRQLCQVAEGYETGAGDELAVVASSHASSPAALSALHAVAPAAAWADAARRMRTALSEDSYQLPHCAAYCAFRAAQADADASPAAVRLLKAVSTVLLRTAEDDVDLALDAEDDAAETEAYEAFRALQCAHEHFVAHTLGLLGLLLRLRKAFTALGHAAWPTDAELGPSSAAILRAFQLHPLASGASLVEPRSVPWQNVVSSLRVFAWYGVLVMLPAHAAAFFLSWRLRQGRAPPARVYYVVLGVAVSFAYATGHAVGDACIMHSTGAAPEWPVDVNTVLHSLFTLWVWRKALFVPVVVRLSMLGFFLCFFAPLLVVAGPRVLLGNVANAALIVAFTVTAVRAGARERAMRALFAARGKAKQA